MRIIITIAIVFALSSCTLQVDPDGTRTWGVDAAQAVQIIIDAQK